MLYRCVAAANYYPRCIFRYLVGYDLEDIGGNGRLLFATLGEQQTKDAVASINGADN
jgi:hypothetical protein